MKDIPAHARDVSPEVSSSVSRAHSDCIHCHGVALLNNHIAQVIVSELVLIKTVVHLGGREEEGRKEEVERKQEGRRRQRKVSAQVL